MSRVRSFFVREATECLATLDAALEGGGPIDVAEARTVYREVRRLRGSAQLARFGELAARAGELERRLRPDSAAGGTEATKEEVRTVADSLRETVEAIRAGELEEDPKEEAEMEQGEMAGSDETPTASLDTLEYRGDAALERALSLREALEDAIVTDAPAGPILDELFDLIRLGRT